jgi:hypothetical protein
MRSWLQGYRQASGGRRQMSISASNLKAFNLFKIKASSNYLTATINSHQCSVLACDYGMIASKVKLDKLVLNDADRQCKLCSTRWPDTGSPANRSQL